MDDRDRDFLMEVFKETGAHIRTTERKSLIVTGAYIGLFSVFLSSLARTCLTKTPVEFSWLSVGIQIFFLLIGTCIYVMQQWYRAWKEHYLEVCLTIRKQFIPDSNLGVNERALPYWLRKEGSES